MAVLRDHRWYLHYNTQCQGSTKGNLCAKQLPYPILSLWALQKTHVHWCEHLLSTISYHGYLYLIIFNRRKNILKHYHFSNLKPSQHLIVSSASDHCLRLSYMYFMNLHYIQKSHVRCRMAAE